MSHNAAALHAQTLHWSSAADACTALLQDVYGKWYFLHMSNQVSQNLSPGSYCTWGCPDLSQSKLHGLVPRGSARCGAVA